ncbi:MAG: hypothetical protein J3K34DRAFT_465932 [Monoraphidium minutum]|nr:MAG: hypothetical protein J3K34DRAFT_465932 [Monoraphidium minutum]
MALALQRSVASGAARRAAAAAPRPVVARRALGAGELSLLAAAGDVDAPIGVAVGAAILVTLVATFIIFSAKEKKPLDKGKTSVKGKGKK